MSKYSQCKNLKIWNGLSLAPSKSAGYSHFCSAELAEWEKEWCEWSKTMDIQQALALELLVMLKVFRETSLLEVTFAVRSRINDGNGRFWYFLFKGINLSGGQRQRICVARALYQNTNIVFLVRIWTLILLILWFLPLDKWVFKKPRQTNEGKLVSWN